MAPKKGKTTTPVPEEPKEAEPPEESLGEVLDGHYLKKGDDVSLHGEGKLVSGPEIFKGTFENGSYKVGCYTSCDGATYEGHFRNNLFHGHGEHKWPDGRSYKGMWRDGYMHGQGEYQNFTFGADKVFTGFSCNGKFASNRSEQEEAKRKFLEEYAAELVPSARKALEKIVTSAEVPKEFLMPAKEKPRVRRRSPRLAAERAAIDELLVRGEFPEKDSTPAAALQAFGALYAEECEKPGEVRVLEGTEHDGRFGMLELRHEQLQHAGQAIELFPAELPEVGGVS